MNLVYDFGQVTEEHVIRRNCLTIIERAGLCVSQGVIEHLTNYIVTLADESFTFEQQADQTGEFTTEINSGLDIELKYYLSDTPIIILQPGQYLGIVGEVFVG